MDFCRYKQEVYKQYKEQIQPPVSHEENWVGKILNIIIIEYRVDKNWRFRKRICNVKLCSLFCNRSWLNNIQYPPERKIIFTKRLTYYIGTF